MFICRSNSSRERESNHRKDINGFDEQITDLNCLLFTQTKTNAAVHWNLKVLLRRQRLKAQQVNIRMSDPTDTSSNGKYSKRREESSESFSPEKRHCQSPSPIAAEPTVSKHQLLVGISTLADDVAATTTASSHEKTIFDLPDDVLALSLAFVGKGTFRYTASVCKTFHKVYKSAFHDTTDTSIGSAVASIACAKVFLVEDDGGLEINIDFDMNINNKLRNIWNGAARHGRVDILEFLNDSKFPTHLKTTNYDLAAEHGHLDALKWFHAHGCPVDEATFALAAYGGHLSVLQWLKDNGCSWDECACGNAAWRGHLSLLQWCRANGCPWDELTCAKAAHDGHLSVLQWCRANGCPWNALTCSIAAHNGHLALLQWCRANGCSWCEMTCASAALNGQLSVLQWCRANGCPWDESACSHAAKNGHLSSLQWCRANECPWDELTCAYAAANGHLGLLQWSRANGCPWDECTCTNAAKNGHLGLLQWCRANGCPYKRSACEFHLMFSADGGYKSDV